MNDHEQEVAMEERQAQDERILEVLNMVSRYAQLCMVAIAPTCSDEEYAKYCSESAKVWGQLKTSLIGLSQGRQAQDEADMALGRLVRQMPDNSALCRLGQLWLWTAGATLYTVHSQRAWTPEEALKAAGIGGDA